MTRPLLALCVMVKNEAPCIARTIESCRGAVDHITVLDTGSTDGTVEAIQVAAAAIDVPSFTAESAFLGYAETRNKVVELERARGPAAAEFILMLSADEVLSGGDALRRFLDKECSAADASYLVTLETEEDTSYYPRVLRTDSTAHYESIGGPHEKFVDAAGKGAEQIIPSVTIAFRQTDPERRRARLLDLDIPDLRRLIADKGPDGKTDRTHQILLLGQTYENLAAPIAAHPARAGEWLECMTTALACYMQATQQDGTEQNYARYRFLATANTLGLYDPREMANRASTLADLYPRPEVLLLLAFSVAKIDARQGLDYARKAAKAARDATGKFAGPVSKSCHWQCHLIAAHCAKTLNLRGEVRKSVEAGIAAGGPPEQFTAFI